MPSVVELDSDGTVTTYKASRGSRNDVSGYACTCVSTAASRNLRDDSVLPQYHRVRFHPNHCRSSSSSRSWQALHQPLSNATRLVPGNFARKLVVSESWLSGEQTRARRRFFRRSARPMRSLKFSTARGRRYVADLCAVHSISWCFWLGQPWGYWTV